MPLEIYCNLISTVLTWTRGWPSSNLQFREMCLKRCAIVHLAKGTSWSSAKIFELGLLVCRSLLLCVCVPVWVYLLALVCWACVRSHWNVTKQAKIHSAAGRQDLALAILSLRCRQLCAVRQFYEFKKKRKKKQCISVSFFNNHNKQNSKVSLRICLIVYQLMIGFSTKSHTSGPWLRPLVVSRLHRNSLNFMKPAQTRPPLSLKRTNKIACAKNSACAFFGFTSIDYLIVAQSTQALILTLGGQGWHWREKDSSGWHVIESN